MKRFPDSLSGAFGRADREFVYRVQSTLEKLKQQEDKKVKRKLSLGLILAIILALLATGTALALTVGGWGHIEKAMDLAVESGAYGEWSLEAKLKLIDAMRELPDNVILLLCGDGLTRGDCIRHAEEIGLDN